MRALVRGLVAAACVFGLTACTDEDKGSSPPVSGATRENGDLLEGHEADATTGLTAEQVGSALPSSNSLPDGWSGSGGSGAETKVGAEAAEDCARETGTSCAGLAAMGFDGFEGPQTTEELTAGLDAPSVYTHLFSFDSAENAQVAWKSLVAEKRGSSDDGAPLKISANTEETDAFSEHRNDEYTAEVMMRVGAVVVYLNGYQLKSTDDVQTFAKMQVERITKAAQGKNPDA